MSQLGQFRFIDTIRSLTGNTGDVVTSDGANNINIKGDTTTVTIDGDLATNTLTVSATGAVPIQFDTDAGSAVPSVGVLQVLGGTNINTAGATNVVTVNLDDPVTVTTINATTFDTNVATAGVTLSGTTLSADGTDADIDINITAKGTGHVIIDDLNISGLTAGTLRSDASGNISSLADGTDGQLLIGKTGDVPIWAELTDGNNITCTEGANSISIAVTGTTQYALQVGDATGSLDSLAVGTANQILQSGGAGANPAWSTATYPATSTQGDIFYSSADNTISALAKDATATRYLANTGASNNPAWDQVNLANGVTGTLPVGNGGTGVATITDHSLIVGSGAGVVTELGEATNGQLPIGSTGADPVLATITAGAGITITNGAGSIQIDSTGGGLPWSVVAGTTQAMAINYGYIANNGAQVDCTLPATAAVGSIIRLTGIGAGGWKVSQNAGQTIYFGSGSTTTGVTGYLESTAVRDSIELVCVVADTDFNVISSVGNITVA